MSLTQVEEKYINRTLSDLLERALTYKKLSESKTRSNRDRAIWRAIFIDAARAYNTALMTLGFLATTKLAIEKKIVTDNLFNNDNFSLVTEPEIDNLIDEIYGLDKIQRELERARLNKESAQITAITVNSTKQVREALQILSKYKALDKFIDIDKLMSIDPPETKALPRGNTTPYQDISSESDLASAIAQVENTPAKEINNEVQKSKLLSILED